MKVAIVALVATLASLAAPADARAQWAIARIPTPTTASCINRKTDEITISLRRVVTHKTSGFFTADNKAGVAVMATLNADNAPAATTPSVNLIDIQAEPTGQISLPLEYPIASDLQLANGSLITKNMEIAIYLERTRSKTGFGTVLTTAAQLLGHSVHSCKSICKRSEPGCAVC